MGLDDRDYMRRGNHPSDCTCRKCRPDLYRRRRSQPPSKAPFEVKVRHPSKIVNDDVHAEDAGTGECDHQQCRKETRLYYCEYCGKNYCSDHLLPIPPEVMKNESKGVDDNHSITVGHPCISFIEYPRKQKDSKEGVASDREERGSSTSATEYRLKPHLKGSTSGKAKGSTSSKPDVIGFLDRDRHLSAILLFLFMIITSGALWLSQQGRKKESAILGAIGLVLLMALVFSRDK